MYVKEGILNMEEIYLRPLKESDAKESYKWRNDPHVWRYTGSKPDKKITLKIEMDWIKDVLNRKNEIRRAICLSQGDIYVGNVQLTGISEGKAEFHLFIGDTKYWGKGIGYAATVQMVKFGFEKLDLDEIFLFVDKRNIAAIRIYKKAGFSVDDNQQHQFKMRIFNEKRSIS